MARVFAVESGAAVRIGTFGVATCVAGLEVPAAVAAELAGRPDLRVEVEVEVEAPAEVPADSGRRAARKG